MATDDADDPPHGAGAASGAAGSSGAADRASGDRGGAERTGDRGGERTGDREPRDRDLSESLRQRLEALVPDLVRRTFTAGLGAVFSTEDSLRKLTKDLNVPAVAGYLGDAADSTKDKVLEIIAREVREFLGQMNLSEEIAKLLTTLSFEVKTEIRFIPNSERYAGVEPDVKAAVRVKRSDRAERPERPDRPDRADRAERDEDEPRDPHSEPHPHGHADDDDRPAGRLRRLWRRATEAGREAVRGDGDPDDGAEPR